MEKETLPSLTKMVTEAAGDLREFMRENVPYLPRQANKTHE